MGTLTASKIVETGTTISAYSTSDSSGDVFVNTGVEFIQVQNNHGSAARTVTVAAVTTDISDASFGVLKKINVIKTIAAGQSAFIGPFPVSAYNNASGQVSITYSDSAADMKTIVLYVG
tara:strand:- start:160 stop:516 length:357 start_codon:yes stop_codon:yes gene_type:complete